MRPRRSAAGSGQCAKFGKLTMADAADARGLAQHLLGVRRCLQRLELQHDRRSSVLEQREAVLEVQLHRR